MSQSYSFHLSNKGNSVNNISKIQQVGKHNLRAYKSNSYDKSKNLKLVGSDNLLADIKEIYKNEFDEPLRAYNEGKRADRQISDYLKHISNSRSDVACEIIIQVGDKDYWSSEAAVSKDTISEAYRQNLEHLQKLVPEFKIASAVIHFDESSPHLHIVGVPVADGYKRGLSKQVAKTKVFTAERLEFLQKEMRQNIERSLDIEIKSAEKGRNTDLPKHLLEPYREFQQAMNELRDKGNLEAFKKEHSHSRLFQEPEIRAESDEFDKFITSLVADANKKASKLENSLEEKIKDLDIRERELNQRELNLDKEVDKQVEEKYSKLEYAIKNFNLEAQIERLKSFIRFIEQSIGFENMERVRRKYEALERSQDNYERDYEEYDRY